MHGSFTLISQLRHLHSCVPRHECLSLLDRSVPNGSGKPARFCRAHTGSGGSGNIILVKWLIMKTRNLSSTPNSARRLLDEAIKLYVSNNAAPMVRRARETFHNRDVCAEDGWLFGDENTRGSGNSSRRTNNGGAVHPETRLIGHRILLASVGSFGTVWAYHPKHKMWKVQLEPLDALGYNDIDAGDFEGCGIERIPESRGGGFRVKEDKTALAKLEKKIRATGTAKRPRLSSSVTAGSGGSGTSSSSPSFSSRRLSSPSSGSRSSSRISGASSDRRSTGGSSSSSWKRGGGRGRWQWRVWERRFRVRVRCSYRRHIARGVDGGPEHKVREEDGGAHGLDGQSA